MKVIHSDEEAVVIELVSEELLWDMVHDEYIEFGEEVPGKIVVKEDLAYLYVYVPKIIPNEKSSWKEHLTVMKKTIDYKDFLIMNQALNQIFDYKTSLLPY